MYLYFLIVFYLHDLSTYLYSDVQNVSESEYISVFVGVVE